MKKYLLYYLLFVINIILIGCSNGANRTNHEIFGNLTNYKQITLNGVESGGAIYTNYLQDSIDSIICPNINLKDSIGESLCNANKLYIKNKSQLFNNVNLNSFIKNNGFGIESINLFRIYYTTQGQPIISNTLGGIKNDVSGLVIVPNTKIRNIKGIVLYYHPTVFSKINVPSENNSSTQILLASLYASQGYIVIAPDYVGQGVDINTMHPYVVYPKVNALSGLNMIKATRQFLSKQYDIESAININLYITSYSEGGAYALWASRLLEKEYSFIASNNNISLKKTIAIEGAYDLSDSMLNFAYAKINNSESLDLNPYRVSPGMISSSIYYTPPYQKAIANLLSSSSKIILSSYLLSSFIHYNYNDLGHELLFNNHDFLYTKNCLNIESYLNILSPQKPEQLTRTCEMQEFVPNLFMNPYLDDISIEALLTSSAMGNSNYFTDDEDINTQIEKISSDKYINNSIETIVKPVMSDKSIMSLIKDADTWSYRATTPTTLIYLNYDSVVTSLDSIKACTDPNGVKTLSGDKVGCLEVDATQLYSNYQISKDIAIPLILDHASANGIMQLISLQQIKQ